MKCARDVEGASPGGARERTQGHATVPWVGPSSVSGVLDLGDRTRNAGVVATEGPVHFEAKVPGRKL
jgi:hypothetical protein